MTGILITLILLLSSLTFDPYSFGLDCPTIRCDGMITQWYHSNHRALDISGNEGASVYAAGRGVVYHAGKNCLTDPCANAVTLLHGDGTLATNYWHLDEVSVHNGQTVQKGQKIGTIGMTGITTGPHLHFSVQVDRVRVNPSLFIF